MGRTLLLAGRPGIGKTTLIKAVVEQLPGRVGGFYTEEILGPGGRKGFRLTTLEGRSQVVAHIDHKSRSTVGRYGVDVAAIDRVGAKVIMQALDRYPIILIDEIGRMQLFSSQFQSAVLKAVSSPKIVVATLMLEDHPWTGALKALPFVTTWEVTLKNRSKLVAEVINWIELERSNVARGA
jgi:nucleoside-triphosphatase